MSDVPAGRMSEKLTERAELGPLFVIVNVYVKFVPATTGSGLSVILTLSSADSTITEAVAELFSGEGSLVVELTVTEFSSVAPPVADAGTLTTTSNREKEFAIRWS